MAWLDLVAPFFRFIWVTPRRARALGLTHHARSFGIVPGYCAEDGNEFLWLAKSSLFVPVDMMLAFLWAMTRQARGEEPDFMVQVRGEIAGGRRK